MNVRTGNLIIALVCMFKMVAGHESAQGALLAYDSFSYTNDQNYYKNGGFGWGDAWGGLGVATGLGYTNNSRFLATTGGSASFHVTARAVDTSVTGPFAAKLDANGFIGKEGTEIWFSYLVRPTQIDQNGAGIQFADAPTANDGTGFLLWFTNGQPQLVVGAPLILTNTYFVVEHVTFQTNDADLRSEFINPIPGESGPTGAQVTNSYSGNYTFKYVTLYNAFSQINVGELRIGDSYADVSPLPLVVLTNTQISGEQFSFSFLSQNAKLHSVEATTNLTTGSWQEITNILGDGSTKTLLCPIVAPEMRYFRLSTQ